MLTTIKLSLVTLACVLGSAAPALAAPAVHGNGPAPVASSRAVMTPDNRCPPPQPHCNQY